MPISVISNNSIADTAVHGHRNLIINGGFQCWQRSTDNESTNTSWGYRTVDRFQTNKGRYRKTSDTVDGRTVDVVQIDPSSGVYHGGRGIFTMIEDYNVYDKPTVLSVYVKADATTTAEIGQLYDYGISSTVQDGTSVNITTDWQRFEVQYPAQTFSEAAANYIINALVDGRTYYVAMAQLEIGTQATPFEHTSYGDELRRCQRYYQFYDNMQGVTLHCYNTSHAYTFIQYPDGKMRATPTATVNYSSGDSFALAGSGKSISAREIVATKPNGFMFKVTASSLTAGQAGHYDKNSTNIFKFDAELYS